MVEHAVPFETFEMSGHFHPGFPSDAFSKGASCAVSKSTNVWAELS
jgi:hypothetical protein